MNWRIYHFLDNSGAGASQIHADVERPLLSSSVSISRSSVVEPKQHRFRSTGSYRELSGPKNLKTTLPCTLQCGPPDDFVSRVLYGLLRAITALYGQKNMKTVLSIWDFLFKDPNLVGVDDPWLFASRPRLSHEHN
jgi:hypothetical protein